LLKQIYFQSSVNGKINLGRKMPAHKID